MTIGFSFHRRRPAPSHATRGNGPNGLGRRLPPQAPVNTAPLSSQGKLPVTLRPSASRPVCPILLWVASNAVSMKKLRIGLVLDDVNSDKYVYELALWGK